MSRGKLAAQACHASLGAYKRADKRKIKKWEFEGEKKVIVQVKSKEDLFQVYELVKAAEIPSYLVTDAGHTELPPSTVTSLGVGPEEDEKIDKITQDLKLLK
jgi:peptidyl-tRNA hydrolase, PTH2 family